MNMSEELRKDLQQDCLEYHTYPELIEIEKSSEYNYGVRIGVLAAYGLGMTYLCAICGGCAAPHGQTKKVLDVIG